MFSRFAHAGVALAQGDAHPLCRIDELFTGSVEQAAVGGVCDGLGLHGRVQHDGVQAARFDAASPGGGFDAVDQQPFAAGLTNALTPAHQA